MEKCHASEVLEVTLDSRLGVMGFVFDLGELIYTEVEVEDLGFVRLATSHLPAPSPGRENDPLSTEPAHVTIDGDDATGEDKSDVFIREHATLVDRLVGDAHDLVLSKSPETRLLVNGQIFVGIQQGEPDRDFTTKCDRFTGRFVLLDGEILKLSG